MSFLRTTIEGVGRVRDRLTWKIENWLLAIVGVGLTIIGIGLELGKPEWAVAGFTVIVVVSLAARAQETDSDRLRLASRRQARHRRNGGRAVLDVWMSRFAGAFAAAFINLVLHYGAAAWGLLLLVLGAFVMMTSLGPARAPEALPEESPA